MRRNLAWILVGLLWTVAAFRIQSYVTGQDPVTYLRLARTLLEEPVGSSAFKGALTEYAPGYPLILAAALRVGGRFAPHWINLGFALGLMAVYAGVMRRLYRDARLEALALVLLSAVLLAGFPMNPHFLLYPFRGLPAYFFCWLGIFLLLPSEPGAFRPGRMLGSSLAFLAAVSVREPMVFSMAGGFAWLAVQPETKAKWRNLLVFCAPPLAAGLALGVGLGLRGSLGTEQFSGWLYMVREAAQGGVFAHVTSMCKKLGWLLVDELTWAGVPLLAAGAWRLRRQRDGLWLFLGPAMLLFIFFALFPYPHRRYVITLLLFLCPILSLGFAGLLDAAADRVRWRHAGSALYALAIGGIGLPLVIYVLQLQPGWGPRVGRNEVEAFYGDLHGLADESDLLITEPGCRNLWDVLYSFSLFQLQMAPEQLLPRLRDGVRCLYLEPLTPEAHYDGQAAPSEVATKQRLEAKFDLVPVAGPRLRIAQGEFQVHEVRLRATHRFRKPLPNVAGRDVIVWVDLCESGVDAPVSLGFASGGVETRWTAEGGGLHAVVLPGASNTSNRLVFLADSESALPRQLLLAQLRPGGVLDFPLTPERSLSVHAWFHPPFHVSPDPVQGRFAASFTEGGRLCLPVVHGAAGSLDVMLVVSPPSPLREGSVQVRSSVNGKELSADLVSLAAHRSRIGFSVPLSPGERTPCVDLRVDPSDARGSHLRLVSARLRVNVAPAGGAQRAASSAASRRTW